MKILSFFLLLNLCCAAAFAQTQPLTVVVLGSSTAAGAGADPREQSWVNQYSQYLEDLNPASRVINLAVGGYTTYQIMPDGTPPRTEKIQVNPERNITHALSLKPDAIIINMPSNDAAYGFTLAEQQQNFRVLAQHAARAGVPLWVATVQPRNLDEAKRENLLAMRRWILAAFHGRSLDFWNGLAEPDGRLNPALDSGDGIHLNNAGHDLLFARAVEADIPSKLGRRR